MKCKDIFDKTEQLDMKIVHLKSNREIARINSLSVELLNHPAEFKLFRRGRTYAIKGSLSIQLIAEARKVQLFARAKLIAEIDLNQFEPEKLQHRAGWGWFYKNQKLTSD